MNPEFPLYIPSKGRSQYMITSRALTEMGVKHYIVVEPQEMDKYRQACKGLLAEPLELDMSYKQRYELLDEHGLSKSTGSGPARNFIWEHSITSGYPYHWIMDDNIYGFARLHKNKIIKVMDGLFFKAIEDFSLRYSNVAMTGPNYEKFCPKNEKNQPYTKNTRIYSCNLIRNDVPFRWRGRYNEDTILSLDMLKKGWCTILFNAFLQHKATTQKIKGGNTTELYAQGTLDKSKMLVNAHPDVSRLAWRFNRWHHYVDYRKFQHLPLVRKPDCKIPTGVNNYGMQLKQIREAKTGLSLA